MHQYARFVSDPKVEHGEAVCWLGRYLKRTRNNNVTLDYCDTARSQHGYVIKYAGCPLLWKSQLQTEIALSSTESEYTGLSYALRDAIPIMELLKELKSEGFPIKNP